MPAATAKTVKMKMRNLFRALAAMMRSMSVSLAAAWVTSMSLPGLPLLFHVAAPEQLLTHERVFDLLAGLNPIRWRLLPHRTMGDDQRAFERKSELRRERD